jgi:hypothetical protein
LILHRIATIRHQRIATAKDPPGIRLPLAPDVTFRIAIQCPFIQTLFDFPCSGPSIRHRRTREKRAGPFIPFTFPFTYIPLFVQINVKLRRLWKIRLPSFISIFLIFSFKIKKAQSKGTPPFVLFHFVH